MKHTVPRFTPFLFLLIILSLLAALWAGLLRLGWALPLTGLNLAAIHGPLMVAGFLGTLISLERAVAMQRGWPYLGPLLTGMGTLLLILAGPLVDSAEQLGILLITAGSLLLVLMSWFIVRREWALHTVTMAAGAFAWLIGNLLWLGGWPLFKVSYWWAGFLLLVIAGERLELSRVLRLSPRIQRLFATAVTIFAIGLLFSLYNYDVGIRLASLGGVAVALWLGRYDIARRTIRKPGLTRFIAWNLLMGYVWLAASGLLGLYFGTLVAGPRYDAWLHTFYLGFVFSMIFAHALIILPAILGITLSFSAIFYLPPVMLQISLLLRVLGDLLLLPQMRRWGGLLNVVTVLVFILLIIMRVVATRRTSRNPVL